MDYIDIDELARKKRAEYMKEYRSRPGYKAKNREYQRNYWKRRALEDLEKGDKTNETNN